MYEFFTENSNGNGSIVSTIYTIDGVEYDSYDDTSNLPLGTYTMDCTVTKSNGLSASASTELVVQLVPDERISLFYMFESFRSNNDSVGEKYISKTFTVPDGVTVLEVEFGTISSYTGIPTVTLKNASNGKVWGSVSNTDKTIYVGVTPGKTYTLQAGGYYNGSASGWIEIDAYYSTAINAKTPSVTDY